MPITRREFYKYALGSAVGLAVLKHVPVALAEQKVIRIPLKFGAGDPGETASGLPPKGAECSIADFEYQVAY